MAQKQSEETSMKSNSELKEKLQDKNSFKQYIRDKVQGKKCIKTIRKWIKAGFIMGLVMIVMFPFITCVKQEYVEPNCQTFRDFPYPCMKSTVGFCCASNLCDQNCIENAARLEKRQEYCYQLFYVGVWIFATSLLINYCVRIPSPQEIKDNEMELKTFQPSNATYTPPTIISYQIQRIPAANKAN